MEDLNIHVVRTSKRIYTACVSPLAAGDNAEFGASIEEAVGRVLFRLMLEGKLTTSKGEFIKIVRSE